MIRLAHVSDVHLFCPQARWRPRDWLSKRFPGWFNVRCLGRGQRFRHAAEILTILVQDIYDRRPDGIVFSGDATAIGFEEEFAEAARLFRVGQPDGIPGVAVPGNHDYYTRHSAGAFLFEQYFGPWIEGERVDDATYPFARKVGPVYLIGLNSSTGNRWLWDATGRVGIAQLDRLRRLLARPDIAACPRILVTHYPIAKADGRPENKAHLLHDLDAVLEVCQDEGVALWLHGHRHDTYHLPASPECPIPSICCGSGTQEHIWSYAEYTLDNGQIQVERRRYQAPAKKFETAETFKMNLGGSADDQARACR